MRVLQIGPYSPPHGGVQAHVVALRKFLQENHLTCDVIDLNRFRITDGAGVFGPRSAAHLFWLLGTLPADIIHMHIGGSLTPRLLGLLLVCGWLPNRKCVFTFHSGGYPSSPQGKRAKPNSLRGWIMRQLDYVIGVNQEIVDVFKNYGVPPSRLSLIQPHALPAGPPHIILPEPLRSFRLEHQPVLLSVGGLEPEYDLPLQIEMLDLVRKKFPAAGLILIGSGSLQSELQQLIEAKEYGRHVLLCGDVDRNATLRVIADSDVFLRTTLFDGDSISVREALHFGVPVIATNCVKRPSGVTLIPQSDLCALVGAIEKRLDQGTPEAVNTDARQENLQQVLDVYRSLNRATKRND